MAVEPHGHEYPPKATRVIGFKRRLWKLFPKPPGWVEDEWPPLQLVYLGEYLGDLGCQTVVVESHYIDRDYVSDVALFYSRSLRSSQNYCQRLHFFDEPFGQSEWRKLVSRTDARGQREAKTFLQRTYLGFSVVRPLPGAPVGRTVVRPFSEAADGSRRHFSALRDYPVHLGCFELTVRGLAFQQQDQGVSACATTALWSSIHCVAPLDGRALMTPAEITEAATRYFLPGGRSLPSEGLTLHQICEATRAAGLAPLLVPAVAPDHDRAQLFAYSQSGFAPIMALQPLTGGPDGHAVCVVGTKHGMATPQTDPDLHYRDSYTGMEAVYVHDDRLGPYAPADLYPYTLPPPRCEAREAYTPEICTGVRIRWPGKMRIEAEHCILLALIVPVPVKLRLSVARMRVLGMAIAEAAGVLFPEFERSVTLNCIYQLASTYKQRAQAFGLSAQGLYNLGCQSVLSRYVGVIEISSPAGALFDVLLDATETRPNPSSIACVKREKLPRRGIGKVRAIARKLAAPFLS